MKKNKIYILVAIGSMFMLSGCIHRELFESIPSVKSNTPMSTVTSTKPTKIISRTSFPTTEYQRLRRSGDMSVKGTIFITNLDGKKIYGKHTRLYLNPVTSYSRQWYRESYIGGHKMAKTDSRLYNYLKFTTSNARGKFAFYGVARGSYYVVGTVKCALECGYDTPKVIRIAKEITVGSPDSTNISLSKSSYN